MPNGFCVCPCNAFLEYYHFNFVTSLGENRYFSKYN